MADIVSAEQLKNGINNALTDNSELFSALENAVGETGATQVLNELSKMGEEMVKEALEGSNTPNLSQANQATVPTPTTPSQRRTEPTTQPESEPSNQSTIEQPIEETKENEEKLQPQETEKPRQETEEEPEQQKQYQPFDNQEKSGDALPWQAGQMPEEPEENEEQQDENEPEKEPTARELDQQKAQAVRQAVNLGQEKQQRVQQIQAEQTATEKEKKEKKEKKEAGGIKGFSDYMVWFVARDLIFIFFGVIPFIGPVIAGPFTLVGVILTFALYYKQDNSSKVAIGKEIAGKSYMYGIMYLISMTLAIFTLDKLLKLKSKTSPLGAAKGAGQPGGRPSATSTKPTK